jgi:hypothetical protein
VLLTVGGLLVSAAGLVFAFFAYQWLPLPAQLGMLAFGALAAGVAAVGLRSRLPIASAAFATISYVTALVVVGAAPAKQVLPGDWSVVAHPGHLWFPLASLILTLGVAWLGTAARIPAWQWLAGAAGPAFWAWSWLAAGLATFDDPYWVGLMMIPLALAVITIGASMDIKRPPAPGSVTAGWWVALVSSGTLLIGYLGLGLAIAWIVSFAGEDSSRMAGTTLVSLFAVTLCLAFTDWLTVRHARRTPPPADDQESAEKPANWQRKRASQRWHFMLIGSAYVTWIAASQFFGSLVAPNQPPSILLAWGVVVVASAPAIAALLIAVVSAGGRRSPYSWPALVVVGLPIVFIAVSPLFAQLTPWSAAGSGLGALWYVCGALALAAGLVTRSGQGLLWAAPPLWWLGAAITTGRPLAFVAISVAATAMVGVGWLRSVWLPRRSGEPAGRSSLVWAAIPIACWSLVVVSDAAGWPGPQPSTVQQVAVFALLALIFAGVAAVGVHTRLAGLIVGGVGATALFAVMALIPLVSGFPTWIYLLAAGLVLLAAGMQLERLRRGQAVARSFLSECN